MTNYCYWCGDILLPGDLVVPEEPHFHGEMHVECEELWSDSYYPQEAPWERWWAPYLEAVCGELTAPAGCAIIPSQRHSS